jgi:hypothetical protein
MLQAPEGMRDLRHRRTHGIVVVDDQVISYALQPLDQHCCPAIPWDLIPLLFLQTNSVLTWLAEKPKARYETSEALVERPRPWRIL